MGKKIKKTINLNNEIFPLPKKIEINGCIEGGIFNNGPEIK